MLNNISIVRAKYPTAVCRSYGVFCVIIPGSKGLSYSETESGAWAKAAKLIKEGA